jgi:folate-binding protein YgfZ
MREALAAAGLSEADFAEYDRLRLSFGVPDGSRDLVVEKSILLEAGFDELHGVDWQKGCYIGQEIVERIRSRGQVHRKFTGFEFVDGLPALGKYESEGRTLAEITTAQRVSTAAGEKNLGLGYIRRESAAAGSQVDLGGIKAALVDLPFERSSV